MTPRAQVLIVEDEVDHAEVMAEALRSPGHVCTLVHSVEEATSELRGGVFDIVVTDLRMPESAGSRAIEGGGVVSADGGDAGLVVLEAVKSLQPNAETVMVTAHGDVATARTAFKHGVYDFVEKPLDLLIFREVINRAAETVLLRHESSGLDDLVQHEGFKGIIAGSEPMRRILETVRTVAASTLPVLITGESGTGKELIAQAVHDLSPRSKKKFATFNCAGQAESLLEDQIFGHVRGAFTGADRDREGVFEYADGGTVFLDEIGDMPIQMQPKLLRVLESGEVVRLGANNPKKVDVRFVSATNQDMQAAIESGSFREDLFFRIGGAHVHLPPLRDRREDIPRIVRHAIAKSASEMGREPPSITDAAMLRLTGARWPGNVRQLLNVVQNMVVLSGGDTLDVRHVPESVGLSEDGIDRDGDGPGGTGSLAGASLEQLEKRAIRETLRLTGGNREQTAKLLGIGERTLYRKLKEYGLR